MFNKKFEQRMFIWKSFRDTLEDSDTPIEDTINFWDNAPITSIAADPWNKEKWPSPWEIIQENIFCPFVKILAICYTLQLTDKFSCATFEIHITQDRENSETKYLLYLDGLCIGYNNSRPISIDELPKTLEVEMRYTMPILQ